MAITPFSDYKQGYEIYSLGPPLIYYCAIAIEAVKTMDNTSQILFRTQMEEELSRELDREMCFMSAEYAMDPLGDTVMLVYFCPINHDVRNN